MSALRRPHVALTTAEDCKVSPPTSPSDLNATSPFSPISPWPPLLPDVSDSSQDPALITQSTASSVPPALPSAKEIYGSLGVLLTALGYGVYLLWAFLPSSYLDAVGWTWYPARDWAIIIPCYLMLIVLLSYLSYAALTAYLTPPLNSLNLVTDRHSHIPPTPVEGERYYWDFAKEDIMPPAVDLPTDLVNRVLYPPRRRPR